MTTPTLGTHWEGCEQEHHECALAKLAARDAELAEAKAHEVQTHKTLGAILGSDDSLEQVALRMKQRAEAAERELAAIKAENSKLRSALEIVHFKREPWQ